MADGNNTLIEVARTGQEIERARTQAQARAAEIAANLRKASRQSRVPVSLLSGGGGFRARKSDRLFRNLVIGSFAAMVLLPFICLTAYFGLIAAGQYATEVKFSIRASKSSLNEVLSGIAGSLGGQAQQESLILREYILSRDMVEAVHAKVDLRQAFSKPTVDLVARFDPEAPIEKLVRYWRWQVDASVDMMSDIISVEVRAFTPEDSLAIAEQVLQTSERLINSIYRRISEDRLRRSQEEMELAQNKLIEATDALRVLRNQAGIIDAGVVATAQTRIISNLKLEKAAVQQELAQQARNGILPTAPQARVLRTRLEELDRSINQLQKEIGSGAPEAAMDGTEMRSTLAGRASELDRGRFEVEIAQAQYAAAMTRFESARSEILTQKNYVIPFLQPVKAEYPLYPKRFRSWSILFLPFLVLWLTGLGIAVLVRDHMAS